MTITEKDIRDKITKLRIERNLSEYKLSLELGQSQSYIQNITSGRASPSMRGFLNICEHLGIQPSEFFEDPIPSVLERQLREEMRELTDEDKEHLLYIVKKMKAEKQK